MQQIKLPRMHLNKYQTIQRAVRYPVGYDVAVFRPISVCHDNIQTNGEVLL